MKDEIAEKIEKALTMLSKANMFEYFELIDDVIASIPNSQYKHTYNVLRNEYISGRSSYDFSQKLQTFAGQLKNEVKDLQVNVSTNAGARQGDVIVFVPKVFDIPKKGVVKKQACVIFDFKHMDMYEGVKRSCDSLKITCIKANDYTAMIGFIQNIFEMIYTSEIVICDLTGGNLNVFYELGIAHTLGKEVVITTPDIDAVPSDLKYINMVVYKDIFDLEVKLRLFLKNLV